eukprot:evm.model.scf_3397.1 EVM.evm.TU.scf_3397.1   scf_3397:2748-2926(-)
MAAGIVAAGAAAIAYYALRRKNGSGGGNGADERRVETHTRVEMAPSSWTGELYLFAEGL